MSAYEPSRPTNNSKELTVDVPKLRPDKIVGRGTELEDIYKRLFDHKQILLVNGMGGVGKTTLAQVYIAKYYEAYQHIAWIVLSSDNFLNDFISTPGLLKRFHINPQDQTPKQLFDDLIMAMKGINQGPCLLVLDNASSTISPYFDALPSQPNWHILATSRETLSDFDVKELGFLKGPEAIGLFKQHYKRAALKEVFLLQLVADLEYHTLTIEILAKTAQLLNLRPPDLSEAIKKDMETKVDTRHADQKIKKVTSYLRSIFQWSELSEAEKWVLLQFTCLPAEYHSDRLIEVMVQEDAVKKQVNIKIVLSDLATRGWLQATLKGGYKLHRIIGEVILQTLDLSEEKVHALLHFVTQTLAIDQTKDNPIDKFIWIPFGKTLLSNFQNQQSQKIAQLQNNLALVLKALGDYQGAKTLLEKAMTTDEKNFGTDHPTTAIRYSNLGLVLHDLKDHRGAKELLKKVMDYTENSLGTEHLQTMMSYSNLATVLQSLGDYQEAKILFEKAIISAEENFGEEHPDTTRIYSNLATVLKKLGDINGAKNLLEKAVTADEKNFGPDHPTTAIRYSNLALVLKDLGDYQKAKGLLEKTKTTNEQNFGPNHPNTAVSYTNLATVMQKLGDYSSAKQLLEKAATSAEKNFGLDHLTTAARYFNLATVLQDLEDYMGAQSLLEKANRIWEEQLGADHSYTKTGKTNLEDLIKLMKKGKAKAAD